MSQSKKQNIIALVGVLSVNAFVAYQFLSTSQFDSVYSKEKIHQPRTPASQKAPGDYKEYEVLYPLEDYVIYDDFNGTVDYKMSVDFWSDKGAKYFTENGKEAISEGLTKGFERLIKKGNDEGKTLKTEVLPELTKEFLNTFVYTIKVVKLIDSNFEFDIMFTPYEKDSATYKDELQTNQLVNIDSTGSLYKEYKKYNANFSNAIIETPIPVSNEDYQYLGGAITLAAEVIDTDWKISQPIPNPKKNGVKGFLRLRKYFRVNSPTDLKVDSFKSKYLNITEQDFNAKNDMPQVVTVDTIYEYNLKNIIPKKTKTIIHFGEIVSLDKKYDSFFKRLFTFFKKKNDIKTSEFNFKGDFSSGPIKTNFKGQIKKLVYDHQEKKFTSKSRVTANPRDFDQRMKLRHAIKKTFLEDNTEFIIKNLNLSKFINN
ncbi:MULTISPECIES: hypothetical protein [Halobacteriovorax]|uniref:Uncharacterized protein n=1 Tax=Halobacteriovorax vibrionivorans TaxID=2152716 RepID=A0ABY0IKG4_9BACT|nr:MULTISPECIES: hypothetical protein [Halobacteriovorax]RZF21802.1 hypothetical protein DAY19_08925 [Halobacteriovorax vibrionivorans]TGD48363.1 hypothetical protein EP118_04370 [Halobacteriovorax sp. Y22]